MAYTITSKCISCNRCQSVCPTHAIQVEGQQQWIDKGICNDCVGYYGTPQCAAVCPVNQGCVPSVSNFICSTHKSDYWDAWFNLHDRLIAQLLNSKHTRYWERWFNIYSQIIQEPI